MPQQGALSLSVADLDTLINNVGSVIQAIGDINAKHLFSHSRTRTANGGWHLMSRHISRHNEINTLMSLISLVLALTSWSSSIFLPTISQYISISTHLMLNLLHLEKIKTIPMYGRVHTRENNHNKTRNFPKIQWDIIMHKNHLRRQYTLCRDRRIKARINELQAVISEELDFWRTRLTKRLLNKTDKIPPLTTNTGVAFTPRTEHEPEYTQLQEVKLAIRHMKPKNSPGEDGIQVIVLKKLPDLALEHLALCKKANVIVFHKPGKDMKLPQNIRPISLLNTLSKVVEYIILGRINSHLENNNLLQEEQFGFRSKHSTIQQLVRVMEYITNAFNFKDYVFAGSISLRVVSAVRFASLGSFTFLNKPGNKAVLAELLSWNAKGFTDPGGGKMEPAFTVFGAEPDAGNLRPKHPIYACVLASGGGRQSPLAQAILDIALLWTSPTWGVRMVNTCLPCSRPSAEDYQEVHMLVSQSTLEPICSVALPDTTYGSGVVHLSPSAQVYDVIPQWNRVDVDTAMWYNERDWLAISPFMPSRGAVTFAIGATWRVNPPAAAPPPAASVNEDTALLLTSSHSLILMHANMLHNAHALSKGDFAPSRADESSRQVSNSGKSNFTYRARRLHGKPTRWQHPCDFVMSHPANLRMRCFNLSSPCREIRNELHRHNPDKPTLRCYSTLHPGISRIKGFFRIEGSPLACSSRDAGLTGRIELELVQWNTPLRTNREAHRTPQETEFANVLNPEGHSTAPGFPVFPHLPSTFDSRRMSFPNLIETPPLPTIFRMPTDEASADSPYISGLIIHHPCLSTLEFFYHAYPPELLASCLLATLVDTNPKHVSDIARLGIIYTTPHTLTRLPQSPDMNSIENIWQELEDRARKRHISLQEWHKQCVPSEPTPGRRCDTRRGVFFTFFSARKAHFLADFLGICGRVVFLYPTLPRWEVPFEPTSNLQLQDGMCERVQMDASEHVPELPGGGLACRFHMPIFWCNLIEDEKVVQLQLADWTFSPVLCCCLLPVNILDMTGGAGIMDFLALFDPTTSDEYVEQNDEFADHLPPEPQLGNVEYKLKLISPSKQRFEHLVTQMKWRLREGQGEAIYAIGVEDNGVLAGLSDYEMTASMQTLHQMAFKLGATITVLRERVVNGENGNRRKVAEVLIRKNYTVNFRENNPSTGSDIMMTKCCSKHRHVAAFSGHKPPGVTTYAAPIPENCWWPGDKRSTHSLCCRVSAVPLLWQWPGKLNPEGSSVSTDGECIFTYEVALLVSRHHQRILDVAHYIVSN
ncbi:hypothetical protein PR048_025503 [Dryococelus australis]|uniref:Uncharacterized protein n=1 Tax=Dryococelus australis TaxID=614101 RepID=A0ABQ9GRG4_9NEOP|nr:hypothetical protein PR048_025503 [Dryococelus australis]